MVDGPLSGRLALVTGASRGIGAATARAFARAGAHVILTARSAGGLEQVEDAIHQSGGTATIAPVDLTESDSIARLAAAIGERWGALDHLILNAATLGSLSAVAAIDPREFARTLTLNVSAQAALIAAFDTMLRNAEAGQVIGITSSLAQNPRAYWGAYAASKAALEALLRSYADEMRNIARVRIALVDPGRTRTRMRAQAYPGEDPADVKPPEVVAERLVALAVEGFETGHYERVVG